MAKNQSSKSHSRRGSSCEKICKSTFGILHYISHSPKNNNIPNPPLSTINNPLQQSTVIPIESVSSPEVKSVKKFVRFSTKKNGDGGGKDLAVQKTFSEDKYNSYIDRMKMKMRASSDVNGGRIVSHHDSFNDKVSSYISRAKLKMRATSSMGTNGKTVSFK